MPRMARPAPHEYRNQVRGYGVMPEMVPFTEQGGGSRQRLPAHGTAVRRTQARPGGVIRRKAARKRKR